jgi:PAS domain S-box-containing protein
MKSLGIDLRGLSAQLILSFIALVLLTAAAVGLPAIWLIRGQLERQAWAQVEQGSRATQALYAAQEKEVSDLAILTAQRPTLRNLLAKRDQASLLAYLGPLQDSADLDLVLICDADQQVVAQVGKTISEALCTDRMPTGYQGIPAEGVPQVWLLASHSIGDVASGKLGTVVVGKTLGDEFAVQMRAQTGLEHTLLVDGQPVASSLNREVLSRRVASVKMVGGAVQQTYTVDGYPYYTTWLPLSSPSFGRVDAEVALAVADVFATRRNLAWTLVGSIIVVVAVGSLLGTFLAREIGRPLTRLAEAATALSQDDMTASVAVEARVREVGMVAQALERARIDLQKSLTELRREKAWTDHLLEAIVEGIVTLDRHGRVTFFSQGAERVTGWSRDQVLGHSCDEVFRLAETAEPFSRSIPPPGQRRKVTVDLANERQATLAFTGARLTPPTIGDARVALVFRDVSEEESVHRIMGHFLANIAHEFRTPLSALAASVELLLDQAPELSAAELQELLTSLHLGILRLQTLVDNLLESASIEAGRFRVSPRPTNLGDVIAEAVGTMQPLLEKHAQHMVVELPVVIPVVRADSRRVIQVLVNLLSNASRYGPDDAEITIGATVSEGWMRVTVSDRGPGVPREHRSDLFRRFVYPDTGADRSQYGVGLGLSVVKAVIQAHGGQVGVEDRPGGGSIFWFSLPVEGEP